MGLEWLAGPVASIAGSLLSSHSAKKAAQKAADLQLRNWAYMQQNAHQFEIKDLRKAGLNPILSATNGQIASPGSAPVAQDPADWVGSMSTLNNAVRSMMWNEVEKGKLENQKAALELQKEELEAKKPIWSAQANKEAWESNKVMHETNMLARNLFEKVDTYDIRKRMLNLDADKRWAEIGNVFADTDFKHALESKAFADTALAEKSFKFGSFIASWLPMAFSHLLEEDPVWAILSNKNEIEKIINENKDIPFDAKKTFGDIMKWFEDKGYFERGRILSPYSH